MPIAVAASTPQQGENALLISVNMQILKQIDSVEFALLAKATGAHLIDHHTINRQKPDAKLFIGSGQAQLLADFIQEHEIQLVIFDQSLSPIQKRNLEQIFLCRVIDRTGLILDIFAQRARSYEGKLQVELAQLNYLSTMLVRGWQNFSRQKGGIGLRGPGETQLETDRRLLRVRVGQLNEKISKVRKTRQQGRAARQKANITTISLVGYTNAGKSTLFNQLTQSDVYAADQLFATLDPTLRRIDWQGLGTVVVADTVGFIQDLPHGLVDAFHATLEETLEADLLLHVIDASSPDMHQQIDAVEHVLKEIGAERPILKVYNKIDVSGDTEHILYKKPHVPESVYISAHHQLGLDKLSLAVQELLQGHKQVFSLVLAPAQSKLHSQLHQLQVIQSQAYDEQGLLHLEVMMSADKLLSMLKQAHIDATTILADNNFNELAAITVQV